MLIVGEDILEVRDRHLPFSFLPNVTGRLCFLCLQLKWQFLTVLFLASFSSPIAVLRRDLIHLHGFDHHFPALRGRQSVQISQGLGTYTHLPTVTNHFGVLNTSQLQTHKAKSMNVSDLLS